MSKIKLATTALGLAAITSIYSQDKPNVVFILTDDLGYGDLSCYGQDKFQTPNIDSQNGTRDIATIRNGISTVRIIKDFFLTLVRYSR
jgi:hypothetical protein